MIIKRRTNAAQLCAELDQFESQFGVPSERLFEAFSVDGELARRAGLRLCTLVYAAYQRLSDAPLPA